MILVTFRPYLDTKYFQSFRRILGLAKYFDFDWYRGVFGCDKFYSFKNYNIAKSATILLDPSFIVS